MRTVSKFAELSRPLTRIKGESVLLWLQYHGMKVTSEQSDGELLRSMLNGDQEALAILYRRWQGGVYRFALQMCGSEALAEDITQEVFMVLIRDGHAFDAARGSLNSFLIGVARNQMLRRLQRERFYVPINEDSDGNSTANGMFASTEEPLDSVSRSETVDAVRRAILSLPINYREAVVLCDLHEMSYAQAAEVLGCAVGTVRSRLHRARALLVEKLRPRAETEKVSNVKSARCFA